MSETTEEWPRWREWASQATQDQVDTLVGTGLTDAEAVVKRHGEFYPFAIVWKRGADDVETVMVAEDLNDDFPDSGVLLDRTWDVLRQRRDEFDGLVVVSDVVVDGAPAIAVALEHRDGVHFTLLQHYRPKRIGRGWKMAELGGQPSAARVWA